MNPLGINPGSQSAHGHVCKNERKGAKRVGLCGLAPFVVMSQAAALIDTHLANEIPYVVRQNHDHANHREI